MISSFFYFLRSVFAYLPPWMQHRINVWRMPKGRATLGRRAFIHRSVQMLGREYIRIGAHTVLSQDCWLNVNHRSGSDFAIDMGDYCFIGRRNFFSSGRRIQLGHYVLTANDCHFLGSTHIMNNPLQPCLMTGTTNTDIISVGHNTFLGAGARILGHVKIGHGCVIGACALVTRDVPPFSQVAGFPATLRRRFSFPRQSWVPLEEFTEEDEQALLNADDYLTLLRQHAELRMPYLAAGSDMGQC